MKKHIKATTWLIVSLCICLISMIFSSAVQSDGGRVKVSELRLVDDSGYEISAQLYKPASATAQAKAPAIVTIEGWFNNKEMQDLFSVEYARRGYVVMAVDMHGHGNSQATDSGELYTSAVGIDAAVEQLAVLPYVDTSRIGITGHSSGGAACDMEVEIDNKRQTPLIAAVLFQASTWVDDTGKDHSADFGNRSVGIIADRYDEFFFQTQDTNGNDVGPRYFMGTDEAKNFVNFNNGPQGDTVVPGKYYSKDGAQRVIYQMTSTHPWVHFSKRAVAFGVEFFDKVLGSPRDIAPQNQIWQWKAFFNFLGLVGIVLFALSFMITMLDTSYFGILKADEEPKPIEITAKQDRLWFWIPVILCAVFSPLCFYWCIDNVYGTTTKWFTQNGPLLMGIWSALSGLFALLMFIIYYNARGKKTGFSAEAVGIKMSSRKMVRTIILGFLTVILAVQILFFANYFFHTDFRLWVLTFKAFGPDKVILALKYLPLFLFYYIINSISVNCFNFNTVGGKRKYSNISLLAAMNIIGLVIFELIQYVTFVQRGLLRWYSTEGFRISGIWLFPAIVYLFVTPFMTRCIYRRTKNPYLCAIVNASIITLMCVANTTTILGGAAVVANNY